MFFMLAFDLFRYVLARCILTDERYKLLSSYLCVQLFIRLSKASHHSGFASYKNKGAILKQDRKRGFINFESEPMNWKGKYSNPLETSSTETRFCL